MDHGKICRDGELMLLVKSHSDDFSELAETIRRISDSESVSSLYVD